MLYALYHKQISISELRFCNISDSKSSQRIRKLYILSYINLKSACWSLRMPYTWSNNLINWSQIYQQPCVRILWNQLKTYSVTINYKVIIKELSAELCVIFLLNLCLVKILSSLNVENSNNGIKDKIMLAILKRCFHSIN